MSQHGATVLLLIDLQSAFCDAAGSMARQGREISAMREAAKACNDLALAARSSGIPVIWTQMGFSPDYSDGGVLTSRLRPNLPRVGALKRGSEDFGFSRLVSPDPGDVVIHKARYSAFYGTALEIELRSRAVETVLVGGVTTSMCVDTTVRDLGQRDYDVRVVSDACADFDAGRHEAALAAMAFGFASLISRTTARQILEEADNG
jgi:ureidoacrylate peracid hydrolase